MIEGGRRASPRRGKERVTTQWAGRADPGSDSHPQVRTHGTPASCHLLSSQALVASPEHLCAWQHLLPRPGYQRTAAQQRQPPASTRLLLTGLPLLAGFLELLWLPGCLLFPCCCCSWSSSCWRWRRSFSRASSPSIRFSITVRCLSREKQASEKEPLCPSCTGHFLLSHSCHPATCCAAPAVPAAAYSCLSKAPNTDPADGFAASTGSFHRWASCVYWNMRLQDFDRGSWAPFKSKRYLAFSYLCLFFAAGKLLLCSCSNHSRRQETSVRPGSLEVPSNLARSSQSFF